MLKPDNTHDARPLRLINVAVLLIGAAPLGLLTSRAGLSVLVVWMFLTVVPPAVICSLVRGYWFRLAAAYSLMYQGTFLWAMLLRGRGSRTYPDSSDFPWGLASMALFGILFSAAVGYEFRKSVRRRATNPPKET